MRSTRIVPHTTAAKTSSDHASAVRNRPRASLFCTIATCRSKRLIRPPYSCIGSTRVGGDAPHKVRCDRIEREEGGQEGGDGGKMGVLVWESGTWSLKRPRRWGLALGARVCAQVAAFGERQFG